jgi:hypothetical protein
MSLLRHSTGKLKAPLTKAVASSGEDTANSAQAFKNIQSYMMDRKSSKDWFGHASRILETGLSAEEVGSLVDSHHLLTHFQELRAEVYLLVLKQTIENPSPRSLALGWKLMLMCCSFFGPGEELSCYLRSHFYQQLIDNEQVA